MRRTAARRPLLDELAEAGISDHPSAVTWAYCRSLVKRVYSWCEWAAPPGGDTTSPSAGTQSAPKSIEAPYNSDRAEHLGRRDPNAPDAGLSPRDTLMYGGPSALRSCASG